MPNACLGLCQVRKGASRASCQDSKQAPPPRPGPVLLTAPAGFLPQHAHVYSDALLPIQAPKLPNPDSVGRARRDLRARSPTSWGQCSRMHADGGRAPLSASLTPPPHHASPTALWCSQGDIEEMGFMDQSGSDTREGAVGVMSGMHKRSQTHLPMQPCTAPRTCAPATHKGTHVLLCMWSPAQRCTTHNSLSAQNYPPGLDTQHPAGPFLPWNRAGQEDQCRGRVSPKPQMGPQPASSSAPAENVLL